MDRFFILVFCFAFLKTADTKIVRRSSGHSTHGNHTHIHWGYKDGMGYGPSNWGGTCAKSTGQSPINVDTTVTKFDPDLKTPKLAGYERPVGNVTMLNNGHSVSISLNGGMTLTLPSDGQTFRAVSFHFHWGVDNKVGSEHTVDGKPFPMEMHVVHVNSKYADTASAIKHKDGLAVLGFFLGIGSNNSRYFEPIVENLQYIPSRGNSTTISGFSLKELIQPAVTRRRFWRYDGSLTTPPCSEVVTWTLYSDVIYISVDQMNKFHKMIELDEFVKTNHRPPQPVGQRVVFASFETSGSSPVTAVHQFVFLLLAALTY